MEEAGGVDGSEIRWRAFSLEQVNLDADADPDELWGSPESRRSLLPMASAKWAESEGAETFRRVHEAFFEALHTDRKKIGKPEVTEEVLGGAGLDGGAILEEVRRNPKWLDATRADHDAGDELGIFGVPTLVFPDCEPVFLRLLEAPEGERALDAFRRVRENAADPIFNEFKRTKR